MQLPPTINSEFRRVQQDEGVSMEDLVADVARLTGKKERQIYNYRSGKWSLPADLLPVLCRRFGSLALIDALRDECRDTQVAVPAGFELTRLVSGTLRQDLSLYEKFISAFESDGIQPRELRELRELAERLIAGIYRLVEVAGADCESRAVVDLRSNQGSSTDHSKDHLQNSTDRSQAR